MNLSRRRLLVRTAQAITTSLSATILTGCTLPWEEEEAPDRGRTDSEEGAPSARIYDTGVLHDFSVELDIEEFTAMVEDFLETEEKAWIHADITIDGRTFPDAGMRLKGNSSLQSVNVDSDPSDLPWLISLDEFNDGQSVDGYTEFVVRSSSTQTALNEALALDLLAKTGLASQHCIATRFSTNGGADQLRLVVQHPDDVWAAENFKSPGVLYKAESGGDYSYRGEDPRAYAGIFDQETGKDQEDLGPLVAFLEFLNTSSNVEFRDQLHNHLTIPSFATYLAFEDLINNFDDIEGLGNNSYLRYDKKTDRITIVAWDHNLAFVGPGSIGDSSPGEPEEDEPSNLLASRFRAEPTFMRLYDRTFARLQRTLYDSGLAGRLLEGRARLLREEVADLVNADTVAAEVETIRGYFDFDGE